MKRILIIAMAVAFATLSACKKENLATVSNVTGPQLSSPSSGTTIAVTVADSLQIMNVTWKKATFGVQAVVTYFVQAAATDGSFSKPINLGTASSDTLSLTYGALNGKLLNAGYTANAASDVQLRVGANIYGKDSVFSAPVKINVTTFKQLAPDKLWLPGSYEGFSPGTAPTIPHVTLFTFEGYAYFSAAGNFKFTSAPDYSHVNYGDGGSGKLTTDGLANGIAYSSAGDYLLHADIQNLTYDYTLIKTFGIIGPATPQGWNGSTAMAFNAASGLWTITLNLVGNSPMKFRANDAWDINYGPMDSNALAGGLTFNDPGAITINNSGNYTITLDMTKTTHSTYYYTIVKN
jgi:hypothetical protein